MSQLMNSVLVVVAVVAAIAYFIWRVIRRWRASASHCGGDCCGISRNKRGGLPQ
jgi:hypothetical protein